MGMFVGAAVGAAVGDSVGHDVGLVVGSKVGILVGSSVGSREGRGVGSPVGISDGEYVHGSGDSEPAPVLFPAAQDIHSAAPASEYFPSGHSSHVALAFAS